MDVVIKFVEESQTTVTTLDDLDFFEASKDPLIYRACGTKTDLHDYPIYTGDYIIPVANGVIVVNKDSGVTVIDKCTWEQESFPIPIEQVYVAAEIVLQTI